MPKVRKSRLNTRQRSTVKQVPTDMFTIHVTFKAFVPRAMSSDIDRFVHETLMKDLIKSGIGSSISLRCIQWEVKCDTLGTVDVTQLPW